MDGWRVAWRREGRGAELALLFGCVVRRRNGGNSGAEVGSVQIGSSGRSGADHLLRSATSMEASLCGRASSPST